MKITTLFVGLLMATAIYAQPKKTELLDLVKALSPDSNAVTTQMNWAVTVPVKWEKPTPQKAGNNLIKSGTANLLVKGKSIQCEGVNGGGLCKWDISLTGNKAGYTSFTIAAGNLQAQNDIDLIDYFFGKGKVKAKLLKKDTESSMFWNCQYKLQLPGKKGIWMKINYENLTSNAVQAENNNYTDAFWIDFYFSEKDLQATN